MALSNSCYGFELWPEIDCYYGRTGANRKICVGGADANEEGIRKGKAEGIEESRPGISFTQAGDSVSESTDD